MFDESELTQKYAPFVGFLFLVKALHFLRFSISRKLAEKCRKGFFYLHEFKNSPLLINLYPWACPPDMKILPLEDKNNTLQIFIDLLLPVRVFELG